MTEEILSREQRRERQRIARAEEIRVENEFGMDKFDQQCLKEKWLRLEASKYKASSMEREI